MSKKTEFIKEVALIGVVVVPVCLYLRAYHPLIWHIVGIACNLGLVYIGFCWAWHQHNQR